MLKRFGTTGVTLALLGMCGSCSAQQTYSPPAPADTYQVRTYAGQPTQWPLRMDTSSGQMAVYQPQPESFEGDKLSARAAISIQPPGAQEPIFGAMWMQARVATDRDTRTVTIIDTDVKRVRFPDSDAGQQSQFEQVVEREFPRMNVTFSLDELLASLQVVEKEKVAAEQLQTAPPRIIVTNVPSTLVVIDGDPKLQPIEQTHIMRVVNTPFIMLMDMDSRRFYLKAGDAWYSATDVKAPWTPARDIPATVALSAARLAAPGVGNDPNAAPAPAPAAGPVPRQVIVTTDPAELISTDGPPTYTPVQGNDLLYVSNTQSDVFLDVASQTTYVLLSGRWYRARSLQGPWEYVAPDQLPPAFARIPPDSAKGHVLASVAGTNEAMDARYDAAIPQTAVVKRTGGDPLNVVYDGQPQFVSVQDSPVQYATNTPEDVLLVDGHYYACHQAVWYDSAAAVGPWAVCVSVPRVIYTLPPSCPVYHVRYCYVYDYTPDVVYCGYVAGYTGCYVYGPTVVWGTGYYYRGWYGTYYYPRPWTWGCGVRYDPYVAAWGVGASYGWDHRWIVRDADRYDHGWFGPRGYVGYNRLAHVNNVTQLRDTHVNLNIYNRTENVTRNVTINRNVNINRNVTVNRNEGGRGDRGDRGGNDGGRPRNETAAGAGRGGYNPPTANRGGTYQNNVYAGHDGQIYRRTESGWEQRSRGGWQKVNGVPEAVTAERGANQGADRGNVAGRGDRAAERGGGGNRGNEGVRSGDAAAAAAAREAAAREAAAREAAARNANAGNRGGNPNVGRGANPNVERGANPNRGGSAGGANTGDGARRGAAEPPRRVETPDQSRRTPGDYPKVRNSPPGLEADHVARERGQQRARGGDSTPRQAAPPRSGDGGGAGSRGGSGGRGSDGGAARAGGGGGDGGRSTGGGGGGGGGGAGSGRGGGRNR